MAARVLGLAALVLVGCAPESPSGPLVVEVDASHVAVAEAAAADWNKCGGRRVLVRLDVERVAGAVPIYFVAPSDPDLEGRRGVTRHDADRDRQARYIKVEAACDSSVVAHEVGHALIYWRGHFGTGIMSDRATHVADDDCAALLAGP